MYRIGAVLNGYRNVAGAKNQLPRKPFLGTWNTHAYAHLIPPTCAVVTKDAATQRGAMRKSDACACNPARRKSTRQGPATCPAVLRTSPCISTSFPPPEETRSGQSFAKVFVADSPCMRQLSHISDNAVYQDYPDRVRFKRGYEMNQNRGSNSHERSQRPLNKKPS